MVFLQDYHRIIAFVYREGSSFYKGVREFRAFSNLYDSARESSESIVPVLISGNPEFMKSSSSEKPHNPPKSTLPLDIIIGVILHFQRKVKGE